ncbi:unnamed protein product [Arctogadus glacialis]
MEKSQYEIVVLFVATLIILFPIVIKTKSFKKTTRKRGKHPLDPRAHNGTSGHAEVSVRSGTSPPAPPFSTAPEELFKGAGGAERLGQAGTRVTSTGMGVGVGV